MKAIHLLVDYLAEPLGLGNAQPRFYWNCEGGVTQTAYQIICKRGNETVWDSGKVASSSMTHIRYAGKQLHSRDIVTWSVQLWDENSEPGEVSESRFELGLLEQTDWTAKWISGRAKEPKNIRMPVDCFRKQFRTAKPVRKARLYASACGLYELQLNGQKVGDGVLLPGNTDIRKRIQYQSFDVTELLSADNTLTAELADGWYRGSVGAFGPRNVYGRQTKLLAQLEIVYTDGTSECISTDESWAWSNDGPIRFADLEDGEIVDARMQPLYAEKAILSDVKGLPVPTASDNVLPKTHERFPAKLLVTPSGQKVLDFGQNLAGFVAFTVQGRPGQNLKLRLGEILDGNGEFTQCNMQEIKPVKEYTNLTEIMFVTGMGKFYKGQTQPSPLQEIRFTCSGGVDRYQSKFMISGFRYALIETDVAFSPEQFESVAVYSDMEQTGDFRCSHEGVNQLLRNNRWSMKSNYCDVPTDCPTRERLAWTGDAQIYFNTGAYFMNIAPFMRKWMRDMKDGQLKNGKLPAVVPYNGSAMCYDSTGSSAGWQDAAILIPYRYWKRYGDEQALRESYDSMKAAVMFMVNNTGHKDSKAAKADPYNKYVYEKGMHLGEWLEPKEFQEEISARSRPSHPEECTAYLHYSMEHMAEVAHYLGKAEDEALFREYADGSKQAYQWLFLKNGAPDTDRQAKLVRPLAFGLADGETKKAVEERLAKAIVNREYKIATGFLSTPFLLGTLTEMGRVDLAYKVLENEECPGWLYQINRGATTNWESWEGYTGYQGTGSFNHYSPGAVCQWLFDTVAGIRVDGENRFVLAPVPGGSLTQAEASYKSLYGEVKSRWEKTDSGVKYTFEIPANCTAELRLPDGRTESVTAGVYSYEV